MRKREGETERDCVLTRSLTHRIKRDFGKLWSQEKIPLASAPKVKREEKGESSKTADIEEEGEGEFSSVPLKFDTGHGKKFKSRGFLGLFVAVFS